MDFRLKNTDAGHSLTQLKGIAVSVGCQAPTLLMHVLGTINKQNIFFSTVVKILNRLQILGNVPLHIIENIETMLNMKVRRHRVVKTQYEPSYVIFFLAFLFLHIRT